MKRVTDIKEACAAKVLAGDHDYPPGDGYKECKICKKVFKAHSYRIPRLDKRGRIVR